MTAQYNDDDYSPTRLRKFTRNACSTKTLKKRLPIIEWLPKYSFAILIQDIIAGITVGLTAIPQGIAYAVVAGLSPEYGLYSGLLGGIVYTIFGSCKDVTVGPTAIMAAMVAKYVSNYSPDFAVLLAFLAGLFEFAMGFLQLGFLVEFISVPVISGFTTAAALQIATGQLKSLFGLTGESGNYFAESAYNFVLNIKTARLWDPILGFSTILALLLLKKLGEGCKRTDGNIRTLRWLISLSRNAIVVIIGMIIAYILTLTTESEPLKLTGAIGEGLPTFSPPPFSSTVGNETYNFSEMIQILGPQLVIIPFVAILESVAIAKAFAEGKPVDATQEMIALGLCNVVASFGRAMPITGSFTRTAVNNASGVQTTAGGIVTGLLILCALVFLTNTFYFIPKASLAGLIITAMFTMVDFSIFLRLWRSSKKELLVITITVLGCLSMGLEYGIVIGIIVEALMLMYTSARPKVELKTLKNENGELIIVPLSDCISYCAAEHVRRKILKASNHSNTIVVIDGTNLLSFDTTVASILTSTLKDLDKRGQKVILLNFGKTEKKMILELNSSCNNKFVDAKNLSELFPN